jgi:uncharacterized protein (TIGR04255 family)
MTVSNHDQAQGTWPNAPLALVLAQIRFDPELDTEYKVVAARLKEALGERFPAMKAVRQAVLVFGNMPVPQGVPRPDDGEVGRELRRDDDRSSLRVQEGVMTYTTSLYKDSPHFLAEWRSMLDCLCAAGGIKVQRIGLRYVDFIIPTAGKVPEDYFEDGFSRASSALGEVTPLTAFMSYEYPKEENGGMRVQFGRGIAPPSLPPDLDGSVQPPPALLEKYNKGPSAVLDIDRWRMDSRRLKAAEIAEEFRLFRDDIRIAFHAIITSEAQAEWSGKAA